MPAPRIITARRLGLAFANLFGELGPEFFVTGHYSAGARAKNAREGVALVRGLPAIMGVLTICQAKTLAGLDVHAPRWSRSSWTRGVPYCVCHGGIQVARATAHGGELGQYVLQGRSTSGRVPARPGALGQTRCDMPSSAATQITDRGQLQSASMRAVIMRPLSR